MRVKTYIIKDKDTGNIYEYTDIEKYNHDLKNVFTNYITYESYINVERI